MVSSNSAAELKYECGSHIIGVSVPLKLKTSETTESVDQGGGFSFDSSLD